MDTHLQPYPGYRKSDVSWLGDIPRHWQVRPNRALFEEIRERNHPDEPMLSVTITQGVMRQADLLRNSTKKDSSNEDKASYKLVRPGDLAYNKMRAWQGAIGASRYRGIVSPAYVVVRPRDNQNPHFFHYLFRTPAFAKEAERWSYGISSDQWSLRPEHFRMIYSVSPPPDEQAAIVRFLDHMNGRIRHYIADKRKLIALLNEQKKAIILRAVTCGIDPDVPRKSTALTWLSELPKHWELRKLKYLARFVNGLAFKPAEWRDSGVPIIRIQNLNGGDGFNFTDRHDLPRELLIQPDDLLFAWSGNRGTSFGSFIWDREFPAYLNQHIFKVSGFTLQRKFFYYLLRAVTAHVEERTHGIIGLVHITKPELGSIAVPVPPYDEQEAIAAKLDGSLLNLHAAEKRAMREIELAKELRARIVADAVTGKMDVREVAAKLQKVIENSQEEESIAEPEDSQDLSEEEVENAEELVTPDYAD